MATQMTTKEREATIGNCLRLGTPMSEAASDLSGNFQVWMADAGTLPPDQEARLLAEAMRQISGRLVRLHGG